MEIVSDNYYLFMKSMEQFDAKNPNYKKEWWEKKGKKYHRITIRLEKDGFEKLERISDKKKLRPSEVLQAITSNALNGTGETLHIESKENTKERQEIIKQALQVFRNLGTNINQIARDLNERRVINKLFGSSTNLTKQEKEKILETIQNLEEQVLKFIKSNL